MTDVVTGDQGQAGFNPPLQSFYTYDNNGNLVRNTGKGMDFFYNYLNLPRHIEGPTGGKIDFFYDATGRKLYKRPSQEGPVLYHDGIERRQVAVNQEDIFVHNENGRAAFYAEDPEGPPTQPLRWLFEYSFRDHLGNSRLTIADLNEDGYIQVTDEDWSGGLPLSASYTEILQEDHYYPFGMRMGGWAVEGAERSAEGEYVFV